MNPKPYTLNYEPYTLNARLYWEQWRVPLEIFAGETVGMAERF